MKDKDLHDMLMCMYDDHNPAASHRFDHRNRKWRSKDCKEHLVLLPHRNISDELILYKEDKDRNDTSPYRDDGHKQDV